VRAPVVVAAGSLALASAAALADPPKPPTELGREMKAIEGRWRCEGKAPAGPMGPEHAYRATFIVQPDLDGFFYSEEYEQRKTKENPLPVHAKGFVTYETSAKKLVFVGMDNGGSLVNETSPGWDADKLVASGDGTAMGQKVGFRETFTKKADRELTMVSELKMGKDWVVIASDTCRK
jgi:hypothetical protein